MLESPVPLLPVKMIGQNQHLISLEGYSKRDVETILSQASELKQSRQTSSTRLEQKRIALLFSKSSTRTRVSFEAAMHDLGGMSIYLSPESTQVKRGETLEDTIKVLERYVHGIVIRNDSQKDLEDIIRFSKVPIINGLSDQNHPCQALGDLLTIKEKKGLSNPLKIVYLGDRNNVATSLAQACKIMELPLTLIGPKGLPLNPRLARLEDERIKFLESNTREEILEEVSGSDVIYTDTWTSMGQEGEKKDREQLFSPLQVNESLVSVAQKDHLFLHCLPAYRGQEVTSKVIDGPNSFVFDQAENRLHVQKALLYLLLK